MKVWVRADSITGYAYEISVFFGAKKRLDANREWKSVRERPGALFQVVDKLTKKIRHKNHWVFFDNAFTSYGLLKFLFSKGIYATGSLLFTTLHAFLTVF